MPKLVISLPDAGEVIHEVTRASVTIGRVDSNTLQIDDPSVSTHHAELLLEGADYLLKDLGSTNGTFLNDEPVTTTALKLTGGDHIRFGKVETIFETDGIKKDPLPGARKQEQSPARSGETHRPTDFAKVFVAKAPQKDLLGTIGWVLVVLGFVATGAALYFVSGIAAPTF